MEAIRWVNMLFARRIVQLRILPRLWTFSRVVEFERRKGPAAQKASSPVNFLPAVEGWCAFAFEQALNNECKKNLTRILGIGKTQIESPAAPSVTENHALLKRFVLDVIDPCKVFNEPLPRKGIPPRKIKITSANLGVR